MKCFQVKTGRTGGFGYSVTPPQVHSGIALMPSKYTSIALPISDQFNPYFVDTVAVSPEFANSSPGEHITRDNSSVLLNRCSIQRDSEGKSVTLVPELVDDQDHALVMFHLDAGETRIRLYDGPAEYCIADKSFLPQWLMMLIVLPKFTPVPILEGEFRFFHRSQMRYINKRLVFQFDGEQVFYGEESVYKRMPKPAEKSKRA